MGAVLYSCNPDSSSSGSTTKCSGGEPKGEARYKLAKKGTYTLTIAECVTAITKGEFSAVTSTGSGARKKDFNTQLAGKLGTKPEEAVTTIVLPSTLLTIGDYAFYGHNRINGRVMIPKQIRTIGENSFYNLGSVWGSTSHVTIEFEEPSQLTAIGKDAFAFANIRELKLPESLETIGTGAFSNLTHLISTNRFTIPGNVKVLSPAAFLVIRNPAIGGTLTIESRHLVKPNLGENLFILANTGVASNFTTAIKLHKAVYDSYTNAELNNIFGTGATYQKLDGTTHTPK